MTLLIKALCGALATVLIAWVGILTWHAVSMQSYKTKAGITGLGAEARGMELPIATADSFTSAHRSL